MNTCSVEDQTPPGPATSIYRTRCFPWLSMAPGKTSPCVRAQALRFLYHRFRWYGVHRYPCEIMRAPCARGDQASAASGGGIRCPRRHSPHPRQRPRGLAPPAALLGVAHSVCLLQARLASALVAVVSVGAGNEIPPPRRADAWSPRAHGRTHISHGYRWTIAIESDGTRSKCLCTTQGGLSGAMTATENIVFIDEVEDQVARLFSTNRYSICRVRYCRKTRARVSGCASRWL